MQMSLRTREDLGGVCRSRDPLAYRRKEEEVGSGDIFNDKKFEPETTNGDHFPERKRKYFGKKVYQPFKL